MNLSCYLWHRTLGWVKHGPVSSSVASHVVSDTGTASQRAPLTFGGKKDQRAHSKQVMSCQKSELCSLFMSWSTLPTVSRTGFIQHCLQRLLLWRHWKQSRLPQTAFHCTARVSSLKQAQHKTSLVRGAVQSCMQWISTVCPVAFATMSLCLFFCAASNASSCAGYRNCPTGFAKACCQQSQAVQSSSRHEEG